MKKILLTAMAVGLVAVSCKKEEKKVEVTETKTTEVVAPVDSIKVAESKAPDAHTAETALDWDGKYEGKVPCASCEGIKMELELKNDKTYTLKSEYLGEKKENKFEDKGTFEFKEGNFIVLKDAKDPKEEKVFFVTEGATYMAEKVGDNSAKPEYKLTKK